MLDMRLKLPDLIVDGEKRRTAYALAKASNWELTITTAARLLDKDKPPTRIDFRTLDILCDVFGVGPGDLLEREQKGPPVSTAATAVHKPSAKKRKPARR